MDHHDDSRRDAPFARALWRHGRDLAFHAERDGTVVELSPAARAWLGGPDVSLLDVVHPHDAADLTRLLTGEPAERAECRFRNLPPAAGWRVVEITATTPTAKGAMLVARDVTRERQAVRTLDAHREVLELVAAGQPLAAVLDGLARSIEEASGGARVVALAVRGSDLELAAAPSLRADAAGAFARLRGGAHPSAFPAAGALNGRCAELARDHGLGFGWAAPVLDGDDALAVLVLFPGAKRFPSAEEQAALEAGVPLAHVAIATQRARVAARDAIRHDDATGVLTRTAFLQDLTDLARRSKDALGVVLVQVDGLEAVNDRAGFRAGDVVLAEVAARLAGSVRGRDIVGRCSGTRFAVGCGALGRTGSLAEFGQRIRATVEAPVAVGDALVPVVVRIATASRTGRNADPEAVVRDAERALAQVGAGADGAADVTDRPRERRSGSGRIDR